MKYSFKFHYLTLVLTTLLASMSAQADTGGSIALQQFKSSCQCQGCDFSHANLNNIDFPKLFKAKQACAVDCDFTGANFSYAVLNNMKLPTCVRGYISPVGDASFKGSNFSHAQMRNGTFYEVIFSESNFSYAQLNGSSFFLADFRDSNFSHANLTAVTSQMDTMHGWGSDFRGANLSNSDLKKAEIYACFAGVDFTHANLTGAQISTSGDAASFDSNDACDIFKNTDFSFANLQNAKFTDPYNTGSSIDDLLKNAILCHTTMPNGLVSNRDCGKEK